jgi:hypothetical protein
MAARPSTNSRSKPSQNLYNKSNMKILDKSPREVSISRGQCLNTPYKARDWLIRLESSLHAFVGMAIFKNRRPGSLFDDRVHDKTLPRRSSACSLRHCLLEGPTNWRDSMKFRDTNCMPLDHRRNSNKTLRNLQTANAQVALRTPGLRSCPRRVSYADRCRGKLA